MSNELLKCPSCNSTQIHASKQGFGVGNAVVGTLTGGVLLGALIGSYGKDKLYLTCLNCNHKFGINESWKNPGLAQVQSPENFNSTVIYTAIGVLIILIILIVAIFG